jgi:hypothetical protein
MGAKDVRTTSCMVIVADSEVVVPPIDGVQLSSPLLGTVVKP